MRISVAGAGGTLMWCAGTRASTIENSKEIRTATPGILLLAESGLLSTLKQFANGQENIAKTTSRRSAHTIGAG